MSLFPEDDKEEKNTTEYAGQLWLLKCPPLHGVAAVTTGMLLMASCICGK